MSGPVGPITHGKMLSVYGAWSPPPPCLEQLRWLGEELLVVNVPPSRRAHYCGRSRCLAPADYYACDACGQLLICTASLSVHPLAECALSPRPKRRREQA
jgi:hypothetical protein